MSEYMPDYNDILSEIESMRYYDARRAELEDLMIESIRTSIRDSARKWRKRYESRKHLRFRVTDTCTKAEWVKRQNDLYGRTVYMYDGRNLYVAI